MFFKIKKRKYTERKDIMNKIFGLGIAVVVTIAVLVIFREQVTSIATGLFNMFRTAVGL